MMQLAFHPRINFGMIHPIISDSPIPRNTSRIRIRRFALRLKYLQLFTMALLPLMLLTLLVFAAKRISYRQGGPPTLHSILCRNVRRRTGAFIVILFNLPTFSSSFDNCVFILLFFATVSM